MKTESRYDPGYVYATCGAGSLEERTHEGWELVESFQDSWQNMGEEKEPIFGCEANHWNSGEKTRNVFGEVTHTTCFLIRRKRGDYDQVKQLKEGLESQREANGGLAQEVKELKENLEAAKQRYDGLMNDKDYFRKQYEESRDANQRMEGDISKLRQHFGEKAVKEALEG